MHRFKVNRNVTAIFCILCETLTFLASLCIRMHVEPRCVTESGNLQDTSRSLIFGDER